MNTLLTFTLLIFTGVSFANANTSKYFCTGEINQFFISFDTKNKTIKTGNDIPQKYWTETNYIFWHTASEYMVYEYTFKNSYNNLSGILKVKSHHLVKSENIWYDYECSITQ